MTTVKNQIPLPNNSQFNLVFKNDQSTQDDSTQYLYTTKLINSSKQLTLSHNIPSGMSIITPNISMQMKINGQRNILSLTQRHHVNHELGSFHKEYHQLVQKFKRRGSMFYYLITRLRQQIFQRDQNLASLQQEFKHVKKFKDSLQLDTSNSNFTKKLIEDNQTFNKREQSVDQSYPKLVSVENEISLQYKVVEDIHQKMKQSILRKLSSSITTCSETTNFRLVQLLSAGNKQAIQGQNLQFGEVTKLTQSLIHSAWQQRYYEEEETFQREEANLAEETIQFFLGKLDVLENKIKMLTQSNENLQQRLKQQHNINLQRYYSQKDQDIEYLRLQNREHQQTIINLQIQIRNYNESKQISKEQTRSRINQLTEAFIRVNKQNRNLATREYQRKLAIWKQNAQIVQLEQNKRDYLEKLPHQDKHKVSSITLQSKEDKLLTHISLLNKQIEIYQTNRINMHAKIAELETVNTNLTLFDTSQNEAIVKQLQQQVQTANYKIEIVESRLRQTQETKITLEHKLKCNQKQISAIVSQLNQLHIQNSYLRNEVHRSKTTLKFPPSQSLPSLCISHIVQSSQHQLKAIIKFYQDESAKNSKTTSQLKVQLSDKQNQISYLKRSLQSIQVDLLNKIKSSQDISTSYINQSNRLRSDVCNLQKQIRQLTSYNKLLSQQWQKHKENQRYNLQQMLNRLSMEITVANVKIKDIQLENRNLKQNLQYSLNQNKQTQSIFKKERKINNRLEQRIIQLEQIQNIQIKKQNRIIQLQEIVVESQKEICNKNKEIYFIDNKIKCLQKSKYQTVRQLQIIKDALQGFQIQNERLVKLANMYQKRIQFLEYKLDQSQSSLQQLNIRIQVVQCKLSETVADLISLELNQMRSSESVQDCKLKEVDENQLVGEINKLNNQILDLKQRMQGMADTQIYANAITKNNRIIKRLQDELSFKQQPLSSYAQTLCKKQIFQDQFCFRQLLFSHHQEQIFSLKQFFQQKNIQIQELQDKNSRLQTIIQTCNKSLIKQQLKHENCQMHTNEPVSLKQGFRARNFQIVKLYVKIKALETRLKEYKQIQEEIETENLSTSHQ